MTSNEKYELIQRVSKLPTVEQLALIEELIGELRLAFTDHAAIEREMNAMMADPGMQRVLRNEDLLKPGATE